jgi:hypothetical protein
MRYKTIVENSVKTALDASVTLRNDILANKPGITTDYVVQVLQLISDKLETAEQYINIEESEFN